ncbi:MAG TPA: hypothetical protein VLX61_10985 [Anaerolineales bacterium]|nr:hypothetical protein [Anaerolineales bacterium]
MRTKKFYHGVFLIAALYDLVLGFVFFVFLKNIFTLLGVPLPDNLSYALLSAAFVFVQGVSYYFVYRNLQRNVDIVRVGIVYKIAYVGVSFYFWAIGQSPHLVFTIFGFLDLIFIALFALYLRDYDTIINKAA